MEDETQSLNYYIAKPISLKKSPQYTEMWLHDRIQENPEILGLGDLEIYARERRQSSGGRIDFLMINRNTEIVYEIEIQLGRTDESHIIRTIEYWDLEQRRYPDYEHKAVIIAEEITNRFFNVIALMNRSIPIIALQVNALQIENYITLHFAKVLDLYETPEGEYSDGPDVDVSYWNQKASKKALEVVDKMHTLGKKIHPSLRITYNQGHIVLGTPKRNFLWFHPRKSDFSKVTFLVGPDDLEDLTQSIENIGIITTSKPKRGNFYLKFQLRIEQIDTNKNIWTNLLQKAIEASS